MRSLLGVPSFAGCTGLARYARSRLKGCPALEPTPHPRTALKMYGERLPSWHVYPDVGLYVVETNAPIRRLVWALPGRGGGAASQQMFLGPYVSVVGAEGVAVISIDGGESYGHPRASGENRLAMLLDEAIPWASRRYGTTAPMGIIGWSMGGYGAINAAEQRPSAFDRVCGVSPALWQSAAEQHSAVPDAFDDGQSFERYDAFTHAPALRGRRVRLSCGSNDPFYANTVAFAETLRHDGVPIETDFFPHGCHDTASWQRTLTADLAFVIEG